MNKQILIGLIVAIIAPTLLYYINHVYAQSAVIEKRFSSCINSIPELDLKTYIDGRPLSYDITGCPIQNVIVHNWDNVSSLEKTSIISILSGKGLIEKEQYDSNAPVVTDIK